MSRRGRLVLFGVAVFASLSVLSALFSSPDPVTQMYAHAVALVLTPVIVYAAKEHEAVSDWIDDREDDAASDTRKKI
jgi:hypothetical protein